MAIGKSLSLTVVRLVLGVIVFVHGLANSFGIWGGPGVERMAADMATQLSTTPDTLTTVVAYAQLVLGLLLLLGLFARVAALVVAALVVVHCLMSARYTAFFVRDDGFEFLLAVAALCLVVVSQGPGVFCVKLKQLGKLKGKSKGKSEQ